MSTTVEIEAYVLRETDKAWLISEEPMGNLDDQWVPKSQARVIETKPNGVSRISCAEWLIIRKGLDHLVTIDAGDERHD